MEIGLIAISTSIGFLLGVLYAKRHHVYGYLMSRKLQKMDFPKPPDSRIYRPYSHTPKRKPRVNDDHAAWVKQKNRDIEQR